MAKKLLIVESPNKIATIKKYLTSEYNVVASVGHILEIPKEGLNIDIKNNFEPKYVISKDKKDVVAKIKSESSKAEQIFLATDADREGEAISQGIYGLLPKADQKKCKRITFVEITKKAILDAIEHPRDIDSKLVNSQKTRQILDRLIGYKISPVLWYQAHIPKSSAGRVQSVALKLVCDKQAEREAFKSIDFWHIEALLRSEDGEFWAKVVTKEKENRYLDEKLAAEDLEKLKKATFNIESVDRKEKKNNPYPPFDTSSLQSTCSSLFGWSLSKSQTVAQKLYEAGKCFLPGTYVPLTDGRIVKIENIVSDEKCYSIDRATLNRESVICSPIKIMHDGNINSLKTINCHYDVTPNHIFPVYDSEIGEIIDKEAIDIVPNRDFLLLDREIKRIDKNIHNIDLFDLLSLNYEKSKKVRIHFNDMSIINNKNIKEIMKKTYGKHTYIKYRFYNMLPLNFINDMIQSNIINKLDIVNNYKSISVSSSKEYNIGLELDYRFYYLMGVVISDGHLPKNSPKICLDALLEKNPRKINLKDYGIDIVDRINKFMVELGIPYSKNCRYSSSIFRMAIENAGIPTGKKSYVVDIPDIILRSGTENIKAFIAGLWDGDGYFTYNKIRGNNCSIQSGYTSSSVELINKLSILLSQFDIYSNMKIDTRNSTRSLKVSIYDTPKMYDLIKNYSLIKAKVYENIVHKIVKSNNRFNARSPYNMPIIKTILKIMNKNGILKNHVQKQTGIDIWSYLGAHSKDRNKASIVSIDAIDDINKLLESSLIDKYKQFKFEPILANEINYYNGPVYCMKSENNYFQVNNGLWTHNCTYIRSDSFVISEDAMKEVRDHIKKDSKDKHALYLPSTPNKYEKKSAAAAQEAHECIRPTHVEDTGADIEDSDGLKMYQLIRDRFMACQMTPQIVDTVVYNIKSSYGNKLIANGQSIKFDGWSKVYKYTKTKEENLPKVKDNETLKLEDIKKTKHSTQPPDLYNEGTLAKKMEADGVGRPSTRAGIITSIQKKDYVVQERSKEKSSGEKSKSGKGLVPTDLGRKICSYLAPNYKDFFMDIKYTSLLEEDLDKIASGEKDYLDVLNSVYKVLTDHIKASGASEVVKEPVVSTGIKCKKCKEGEIVEKKGKFGMFFACNNYPKCKIIYSKNEDGDFKVKEKAYVKTTGEKCPECAKHGRNGELLERKNKSTGSIFCGCNQYPKCKYIKKENSSNNSDDSDDIDKDL